MVVLRGEEEDFGLRDGKFAEFEREREGV